MTTYRKVDTRTWNDGKFLSLSKAGKLAWFTLLTHTDMTPVGAMRGTMQGLAIELASYEEDTSEANVEWYLEGFREAFRKGMVEVDPHRSLIVIPNFLRYNPPANPNVVKAWVKHLDRLPESELLDKLLIRIETMLKEFSEPFQEPFRERFGERYAETGSREQGAVDVNDVPVGGEAPHSANGSSATGTEAPPRVTFKGLDDGDLVFYKPEEVRTKDLATGDNTLSLEDIPELPKNTQAVLWIATLETKARCREFMQRLEQRGMRRFEFANKALKDARSINPDYPQLGVQALFWTTVNSDLWDRLSIPEPEHDTDIRAYLNSWVWRTKDDDDHVGLILQAWREFVPHLDSGEDSLDEVPVDGLTEAVTAQ